MLLFSHTNPHHSCQHPLVRQLGHVTDGPLVTSGVGVGVQGVCGAITTVFTFDTRSSIASSPPPTSSTHGLTQGCTPVSTGHSPRHPYLSFNNNKKTHRHLFYRSFYLATVLLELDHPRNISDSDTGERTR